MKTNKIIFWTTTIIIFLLEGLVPALTSQSEQAKESMKHLGYPAYFGMMLTVFKVFGALALLIPKVSNKIKEWAYAGFAIDFIAAFISIVAVDGLGSIAFFPIVALGILVLSYIYRLKIITES
jgi:hypothetical protein